MKYTYYFVNDNGSLRTFGTDSEREIQLAQVKYGTVFFNRTDAIKEINKPVERKVRRLTEKEQKEQYLWGLSQMTETDKAIVREQRKSIDQQQLEFARMMMKKERELK